VRHGAFTKASVQKGLQKSEKRLVVLPTEVVGATIFPVAIWALFVANVMVIFKA
jgi:hypothetical protein